MSSSLKHPLEAEGKKGREGAGRGGEKRPALPDSYTQAPTPATQREGSSLIPSLSRSTWALL